MRFSLAACAQVLWQIQPIHWCAAHLYAFSAGRGTADLFCPMIAGALADMNHAEPVGTAGLYTHEPKDALVAFRAANTH